MLAPVGESNVGIDKDRRVDGGSDSILVVLLASGVVGLELDISREFRRGKTGGPAM